MGHETALRVRQVDCLHMVGSNFVILSSIDLGSKMKVGRVTRLRSAPGRNWDMIWDRTVCKEAV